MVGLTVGSILGVLIRGGGRFDIPRRAITR
jgi:hypothetical protein